MTSPSAPASRQTRPAEILTPAEVAAIIGTCSSKSRTGIRNRAMLTLLHKGGLRISEVIGYPGRDEVQYTTSETDRRRAAAQDNGRFPDSDNGQMWTLPAFGPVVSLAVLVLRAACVLGAPQ